MKEYNIISDPSTRELSKSVENLLAEGWELYGDPFVFGEFCCQAVVRDITPPNSPDSTSGDPIAS